MVALGIFLTYSLLFYASMDVIWPTCEHRFKRPLVVQYILRILLVLGTGKLHITLNLTDIIHKELSTFSSILLWTMMHGFCYYWDLEYNFVGLLLKIVELSHTYIIVSQYKLIKNKVYLNKLYTMWFNYHQWIHLVHVYYTYSCGQPVLKTITNCGCFRNRQAE